MRGIRNGSAIYLTFSAAGLLQINAEDTLAVQQSAKPAGSNSTEALNGGWPAYEFGDNAFSGILRDDNGGASLSLSTRSTADTPNQYTVEFQDEFNEYQQDSLLLVDINDSQLTGQEITSTLSVLGLPNADQASRALALQLYKSTQGNTYVEFETSVKGVGLRPGDIITVTYAKEGFNRQPFRITKLSPGVNFFTAVIDAQIHDDAWYTAVNSGSPILGRQPGFEVGLPRPLVGSVFDSGGTQEFGISESSETSSDGTIEEHLSVAFSVPAKPAASTAGIPLVGLNPQISSTGGTLAGGQTLYYALSAVDANGAESGLSFSVMASIPAGTNTNQVTLGTLSFSSGASSFCVYRGTNPIQLLRVATNVAIAAQFIDAGATAVLQGPPDYNYDHANFYWRLELQPEENVDIHSPATVGNSTLNMLPNEYVGAAVRISKGAGAGQEQTIAANSATTITTTSAWTLQPDATSAFLVADSAWQFGASSNASPVSFEVPNREGITIHVSGRAANVRDEECAFELSPLTRWRITGAAGDTVDSNVPGQPAFTLSVTGQGSIEIAGIGFASLDNTRTITAGTLTLAYWDELSGSPAVALSTGVGISDTTLILSSAVSFQAGDLIQIESEIMAVPQAVTNSASVAVTRASLASAASIHSAQVPVYFLAKKTFVMGFAPDFFGSPASGSFAFPVSIPDVRLARSRTVRQ